MALSYLASNIRTARAYRESPGMLRANAGVAALTIMNPGPVPHMTSADVRRRLKENTMAYDLGALLLENKRGKKKAKKKPAHKKGKKATKRGAKKAAHKKGAKRAVKKSGKKTSKTLRAAVSALKKLRTSRTRIYKKASGSKAKKSAAKTSRKMITAAKVRINKARKAVGLRALKLRKTSKKK